MALREERLANGNTTMYSKGIGSVIMDKCTEEFDSKGDMVELWMVM